MPNNNKRAVAPQRRFVKFDVPDHAFIKVAAAKKGKTMGKYLTELAKKDK